MDGVSPRDGDPEEVAGLGDTVWGQRVGWCLWVLHWRRLFGRCSDEFEECRGERRVGDSPSGCHTVVEAMDPLELGLRGHETSTK